MKKTTIIYSIIGIIIIVIAVYFMTKSAPDTTTPPKTSTTTTTTTTAVATTTATVDKTKTVIGQSVENRDIVAYHFGDGAKEILFVGGIHGGYEWNTSLVAYQLMDYLKANPSVIPATVKVTVIPVLNPDGLYKVTGTTDAFTAANVSSSKDTQVAGRFNAHTVDLNRNFDCDWQAEGVWQTTKVSGGTGAFSEPESQSIQNYVQSHPVTAAVVWYSAAGGVYASTCHNGVLPETDKMTTLYGTASGYPAHQSFDFYTTTGDMVNWFAKKEIPAISVLLTNHTDTEWSKNKEGVTAILNYFAK